MKCGLLGEKLGHSFSPFIPRRLAPYDYTLMPVPRESLDEFMTLRDFDGLNVTIPYKQDVMKYCASLSDEARAIGSVNTIVNRDGELSGYNTDIYGFIQMVSRRGISFSGRRVLILGTGGTSKTARAAAEKLGARDIITVSRSGSVNYENVYDIKDAEIIVNTTPVGMFPGNLISPVEPERFPNLQGVVDVVYNPLKTALILRSEALGIPCTGGLMMLVAQAKASCELFLGKAVDDGVMEEIYRELLHSQRNIILVGMPGSGKSSVSRALGKITGREFIDADDAIAARAGMDIPSIFAREGESGFRRIETEVLRELGAATGRIIATGGGCVLKEENYFPLKQNGVIVFLRRDTALLSRSGRPLSQGADMDEMYSARLPHYMRFADVAVDSTGVVERTAQLIKEVTDEISDN